MLLGLQNALRDRLGSFLYLPHVVGGLSVTALLQLGDDLIQSSQELGVENPALGFQQLPRAVWIGGIQK